MKAIGIKILKNQLSRYLKLVREGEMVYVTDRDEVIAEIHKPFTSRTKDLSAWECFLNVQEHRGLLKRAKYKESRATQYTKQALLKGWRWPKSLSTQKIIDETRSDRW